MPMLIELPFPVVPRSEYETVADLLHEDSENIYRVLKFDLYCSTGFNDEFIYSEESGANKKTGSEAIVRMAEIRGVAVPMIKDFAIPDGLFLKRVKLFDLVSVLESRLWRLQILMDNNAPRQVIQHEKHALCNAVWKILEFPI